MSDNLGRVSVYEVSKKGGKVLGYFPDMEIAKQFCKWHLKEKSDHIVAFHVGFIMGVIACAVTTYMVLSCR